MAKTRFQEVLDFFQEPSRLKTRFDANTYKSLPGTIFKNRELRIESEHNDQAKERGKLGPYNIFIVAAEGPDDLLKIGRQVHRLFVDLP